MTTTPGVEVSTLPPRPVVDDWGGPTVVEAPPGETLPLGAVPTHAWEDDGQWWIGWGDYGMTGPHTPAEIETAMAPGYVFRGQ